MPDIILTTLNARYIHTAFGLRYLLANLGELRPQAQICEFTIHQRPLDIVEQLLALQPKIIGFGIYIWNVREVTDTVAALKQVAPDIKVVLGGPEISYETEQQPVAALADYVITGSADKAFAQLCQDLLSGRKPLQKVIHAGFVLPSELVLPYETYNNDDIAHRVIYVEASRGCPFRCEFCLSALDKTAYAFDLGEFLEAMEKLWQRGVRRFKFVDRTFNLKIEHSARILQFFLERLDTQTFLHFELIPDNLPDKLKQLIQQFPAGSLQFEIGIQSFNPEVQHLISRKQDNSKSQANLQFLREQTHAHLHTDLIAGLPGEDLHSFGHGFDRLLALNPHEIQLGILKRLRGSPIIRHTEQWQMRYNPNPPYNLLSNRLVSFDDMQRLNRFARYWDLFINSGRFPNTKQLLLGEQPFVRFMQFCDWLYADSGQTHKLALDKLFDFLYTALTDIFNLDKAHVLTQLQADFQHNQVPRTPVCLRNTLEPQAINEKGRKGVKKMRQDRHLKQASV